MQRREFITLVGGAATTWPLAARAQRTDRMRTVGMLLGLAEKDPETINRVKAFRSGMRDLGWIEGRNVQIEYRFAETNLESINKNVAELVQLAPDVIVANSSAAMVALRPATSTIPIVAVVSDPVGQGFISNLAHPGGNITGFSFIEIDMVGKWVDLLRDVKPNLSRVLLMFNPHTAPLFDAYLRSFKAIPQQTSVEVEAVHVRSVADVELAVAKLGREPGAVSSLQRMDFILAVRGVILKAADQHRVPVISAYRQFVIEGSLMLMALILPISSGVRPHMLIVFSKANCRAICQHSHQSSLNSSSILKRPRPSASSCFASCSYYSPTRSSNSDAVCCTA